MNCTSTCSSLQNNELRFLPERRQAQIHGDFTQITAQPLATDTSARVGSRHHAQTTGKHSQHHPRTRLSELHTCTKAKCWASVDSTAFTGASVTPSMEWQNLSPEKREPKRCSQTRCNSAELGRHRYSSMSDCPLTKWSMCAYGRIRAVMLL
jgi:hypothetical protein